MHARIGTGIVGIKTSKKGLSLEEVVFTSTNSTRSSFLGASLVCHYVVGSETYNIATSVLSLSGG